ncbi:MAG: hypothetical protein MUF24_07275 [Chitinophagaceae bacterium]|nr:hypothetical protein [Chitinophagaceae bacterium]
MKLILLTCIVCSVFNAIAQNVGIGTSKPAASLHLRDNTPERLRLENSTPLGLNVRNDLVFRTGSFFTGQIRSIGTTSNSARLGFYTGAQASADEMSERLTISDNGMVGIGTVTPQHPLTFNSVLGDKISFWGGTGSPTVGHYGIGIANSALQLYSAGPNDDIVFGHGRSGAFVENVRMKGNGNVGIGTNNPTSRLTVFGSNGFEHTNGTAILRTQLFANNLLAVVGTATNTNLSLQANNGANGAEIRILNNGNVGIGTITPEVKLDVNGWSRFSQRMLVTQNIGAGDGEALELVGAIKTSGPYKFAFRVDMGTLSGNPKFFQVGNIDYYNITTPLIANNPDAIVVATPLSTVLSFPFWVGYDATNAIGGGSGQWYLAEPRNGSTGGFVNGSRFNVIVIK